jgi:hypothetical protein
MGKWGKWVMLFVVAMAFALPAWAVDLQMGGKYEIQGRYYAYPNIVYVEDNSDFAVTDMYLKHYFNLYPTLKVNENIKIVGNLEVFDNKISRNDEVNWDGIYQAFTFADNYTISDPSYTGSKLNTRNYKPYNQYNLFTVDELYADVTTNIGKFIAGKTKDFSGIAYFIQVPQAKDWTFGLVWNKKQELGSDYGTKNQNNTGDQDEFEGVAKFQNAATLFDFRLAYKYSGPGHAQTRVWYPHFWFNQKFNDMVKMNLKLGYGTGVLANKNSPVGTYTGLEEDWKVNNIVAGWIGVGITPGNAAIQIDAAYLPGAKKPYEVSAYLDDNETLDAWLMNDIHDIYAWGVETFATQAALGDPRIDGNYSFTNAILGRLNLGYKFTDKLKGDLNFIYGQKENTTYLENWYPANNGFLPTGELSDPGVANAVYPTTTEGILSYYQYNAVTDAYDYYFATGAYGTDAYKSTLSKSLGYELRGRLNYAWMDNLSIGIDLAYYQPGDFYKRLIEDGFRERGSKYMKVDGTTGAMSLETWNGTGREMKTSYAARWIAKVTF